MANEQDFKSHARYEPLFHFVAFPILVGNVIHSLHYLLPLSLDSFFRCAVAIALVLLAWYARKFPLKAQDRVIRLEERLRLRELAPELAVQAGRITTGQWVALRFASDDELPGLVRQVLDGKLTAAADIKKAIVHWRADHQRV